MGLLNQAMELQNLLIVEEGVEGVVEVGVTGVVVVVVEVEEGVVEEEVERRLVPQCLNLSQVLWRRLVLRPNVPPSQTGLTSTSNIDMFRMCASIWSFSGHSKLFHI